MNESYNVIIVEDQPADADLIDLRIRNINLDIQTRLIQSIEELKEVLEEGQVDLVLSDYDLGECTGKDVLRIVKTHSSKLPFILVSGYLGEKKSIEIMADGADDFVLKDDLERLPPVIKRELENYREHLRTEQQRDKAFYDLQERVKEQKCLHNISRIYNQDLSIDEFLSRAVEYLPPGWQYPDITEAIIEYGGNRYQTDNYKDSPWSLTAKNKSIKGGPLTVNVVYLEEKPPLDEGPFLNEERYLIDSILDRLSLKINLLLEHKELEHKQQLLDRTNALARIGNWQVDVEAGTISWSPQVYEIHEVDPSYEPTLEEGINFYKEGKHREKISNAFTKAVEEGKPYDVELIIVTEKGNERWIRAIGEPEFNDGRCVRVYGSFQDIDQKKRNENDLREAEKKLRDIVEHSTNLFYRHDTNHVLTYVSPQSEHFFACTPEEAMHNLKEFITDHPVNQKGIELTDKAIETGEVQDSYKLQLRKKNGQVIWVRVFEAPIIKEGEVVGITGSLTDITELMEAQKEQEMLAKLAQETPNVVIITDRNHQIEWVNESFETVTGYTFEEIKGLKPHFLSGPKTDVETEIYIHEHLIDELEKRGYYTTELINYTKDGHPYWVEVTFTPVHDDSGVIVKFFSIQEDITARKKVVAKLNKERERLKEAQRVGQIGDWEYDLTTDKVTWSDMLYEIFERDPNLGAPGYKKNINYYFQDKAFFQESVRLAIEEAVPYSYDIKIKTEQGNIKYVHLEGVPKLDENGDVERLQGIVQDITERKQKEQELDTRQKQLQAVSDNVDALLFRYILKPDGTDQMVYVSDSIQKIYEVSPDEAMQSIDVVWNQVCEKDIQKMRDSIQESAETLTTWDCRFRAITLSGEKKWLHGRGNPTRLDDGSIQWDTVIMDVTEQVKQERMNETLVQEVQHRVKNNLAIITGFLELQLADLDENSQERLPLERAMTRIFSIAEVHKLLYDGSTLMDIDVKEYMDHLVDHVTETMKIGDRVNVDVHVDSLLMNVNELTPLGMLMNELLTNSMKYAFDGGKEGHITVKITKEDRTYQVLYRDNGPGLDPSAFEKALSTGLNIIKILLAQLEAEYQLLDEDGFSLAFSFKERTKGAHGNVPVR